MSGIVFSTLSAHFQPVDWTAPGRAARQAARRGPRGSTEPVESVAASYSRYSTDLQDDSSIEQQQRKCQERAAKDNVAIRREFEFADAAVSGTKRERVGLNAMLAAARAGQFQVLYFDSLSRLARESIITMPMLKDLVYNHRIRIVSVTEGIDSSQNNWDLIANFMSWMHEQFLKALRAAVLRGQEHAILNDWSCGDWCFGYASEPIPGTEAARRGRDPKPRKRVIINPDHAAWVRQIFQWFVVDGWKMDRITRELTRLNAPKDHRSTKPGWHHDYVRRVLRNEKYVGIWPWGQKTNVRNPLTGQIYQEGRAADEVAKWVRLRPELRIVDDEIFNRAQVLLDANEAKWATVQGEDGRFTGPRPEPAVGRHVLQGVLKCAACGGTFQVCGANGRYMGCSRARRGLCVVQSFLPRALAEERLVRVVAYHILGDRLWLDAVVSEALAAWEKRQQSSPSEAEDLVRQIEDDRRAERRLMEAIELGSGELSVLTDRLRDRTLGRKKKEYDLTALRKEATGPAEPPTRAWVEGEMSQLVEILRAGGTEANTALKRLLPEGVAIREARSDGRKRVYFMGTFSLCVRGVAESSSNSGPPIASQPLASPDVIEIEFREAPPWAALSQKAKDGFDAGKQYRVIASELGCHPTWVPKALAWWHTERGLAVPDGRNVRSRLDRPVLAERSCDEVKELWDRGLPMQDIAEKLGCSRDVVTAAIRHWFGARGLVVPDGRHRRKELKLNRARTSEGQGASPDAPSGPEPTAPPPSGGCVPGNQVGDP